MVKELAELQGEKLSDRTYSDRHCDGIEAIEEGRVCGSWLESSRFGSFLAELSQLSRDIEIEASGKRPFPVKLELLDSRKDCSNTNDEMVIRSPGSKT